MSRIAGNCKYASVYTPGMYLPSHCSKRAIRDGWCAVHHPDAVAKRRADSLQQYNAKRAAEARAQLERDRGVVRTFLTHVRGQLPVKIAEHLERAVETWE